jgi:hypothetical protein
MISAEPVKRTKFTAVVNGRGKAAKRAASKTGAPRRKNPIGPATVLLGYINPEGKPMSTKTKTKKKGIRRQAKNPISAKTVIMRPWKKNGKRNRPRRKNPLNINGVLRKPVELLKLGAIGAIAYFVSGAVPTMLLKDKNKSWLGYVANLLTALGSAAAADKYFGTSAGQAAFVGGGMFVVGRIANERTPYGAKLGLSGYVPAFFASPAITTRDGTPVMAQFQPVIDEALRQVPQPAPVAAAGVSGGRFASRFRN